MHLDYILFYYNYMKVICSNDSSKYILCRSSFSDGTLERCIVFDKAKGYYKRHNAKDKDNLFRLYFLNLIYKL